MAAKKNWYILEYRNGSDVEYADNSGCAVECQGEAAARRITADEAAKWAEDEYRCTAYGWTVTAIELK